MFHVHVTVTLPQSAATVFAALTDHDNYGQFPGVDEGRVLEPGSDHRNGTGALRVVRAGPLVLHERITAYEPDLRMAYRIERARPLPLKHEGGEIRLTALGEASTQVDWVSTGRVAIPVLGPLIDRVFAAKVEPAFRAMLGYIGDGRAA